MSDKFEICPKHEKENFPVPFLVSAHHVVLMSGRTKRKDPGVPPSGRAAKRRTAQSVEPALSFRQPSLVRVILSENTRQVGGLASAELLRIADVGYLENISDCCEYLYDIVSRICGVDSARIKLYIQNDGKMCAEDAPGWNAVDRERKITPGNYLCVVPVIVYPPPPPSLFLPVTFWANKP